MTVTSIDISPDLLAQVKSVTGLKTNKDAVTFALEEVVRRERTAATLQWMYETDPAADLNDPEVKAQARS